MLNAAIHGHQSPYKGTQGVEEHLDETLEVSQESNFSLEHLEFHKFPKAVLEMTKQVDGVLPTSIDLGDASKIEFLHVDLRGSSELASSTDLDKQVNCVSNRLVKHGVRNRKGHTIDPDPPIRPRILLRLVVIMTEPPTMDDLNPVLRPIPYAMSCGIHGDSRPTSTRVAHNPSLLPHVGTVPKSPVGRALYGLFKPLLMIARDVSRFHTSMELSSLTRVPLGHLDTDLLDAVQHSFHRLRSLCVERVNISIGRYVDTAPKPLIGGFGMSLDVFASFLGAIDPNGTYVSYEIAAERSGELTCGTPIESHGVVHISDTEGRRSMHPAKAVHLPKVLIQEKSNAQTAALSLAFNYDSASLVDAQDSSKAAYFIEFKPSMPREVRHHHFGTTQYSYGIFQAPNLPNMAMIHWIMSTHCCMVEPRFPANKHACWKK